MKLLLCNYLGLLEFYISTEFLCLSLLIIGLNTRLASPALEIGYSKAAISLLATALASSREFFFLSELMLLGEVKSVPDLLA
jgi:hypothetical protein